MHFRPQVIARRTKKAIRSRVAASSDDIFMDGTQTPNERSPNVQIYFLGMHAVAACCRKCIQYWHGIPMERPLSDAELTYLDALVWLFVCQRLDWPEHIDLLVPQ